MPAQDVARLVIALVATAALAVLAGHPRVRSWEERLGLTVFSVTGFPFLLLGYVFRRADVLSNQVLVDLRPGYEFALGWIGFVIGTTFSAQRLDRTPAQTFSIAAATTLPPMILTGVASSLVLLRLGALPGTGLTRDVLLLMACAAVSAPATAVVPVRAREVLAEISRLDQIVALAILAFVAIEFRPDRTLTLWRLPRSAWFLVMLGLGSLLGLLIYLLIRRVHRPVEEGSYLIGGIALAAGLAGYLALSVPVVCALAGATLANLPLRSRRVLRAQLGALERPLYLIFLFIVGALWRPEQWQGWVLGLAFFVTRTYGKLIGVRIANRFFAAGFIPASRFTIALLPESAFAVVVLVSVATLHGQQATEAIAWAIHAVVIGSILTEFVVQWRRRTYRLEAVEEAVPA